MSTSSSLSLDTTPVLLAVLLGRNSPALTRSQVMHKHTVPTHLHIYPTCINQALQTIKSFNNSYGKLCISLGSNCISRCELENGCTCIFSVTGRAKAFAKMYGVFHLAEIEAFRKRSFLFDPLLNRISEVRYVLDSGDINCFCSE